MARQSLPIPPLREPIQSRSWNEWLRKVYIRLSDAAQLLWTQIDTTGSNLTDLETRNHKDLQSLQGGVTDEYYHLTSSQHTTLTGGGNADSLHTHAVAALDADDILMNDEGAILYNDSFNVLSRD